MSGNKQGPVFQLERLTAKDQEIFARVPVRIRALYDVHDFYDYARTYAALSTGGSVVDSTARNIHLQRSLELGRPA